MRKPPVYLDHAATTPTDEAVISAMSDCMRAVPYNASAAYSAAGEARRVHRLCRRQLAAMLGCDAAEVYFTSGGTEANNWVIRAFSGRHVVLSAIEHHSILDAAKACGCRITLVQPDESGWISPEAVEQAIAADTALVCLQAANNETGVIQPVAGVHAVTRRSGVHLHVDAVQAFGHIPVSARDCESMSLSAHKFYGPRGAGALMLRGAAPLPALLIGGGQENGMRAGTENTPAICGLYVAAQMADEDIQLRAHREKALIERLINQLALRVPQAKPLGLERERLPGVIAIMLPRISAEKAIAKLDLLGVIVSGGAACAAHSSRPSHVYTAMGLSDEQASRVIRISVGRGTSLQDIDAAAQAICSVIPPSDRQSTSE